MRRSLAVLGTLLVFAAGCSSSSPRFFFHGVVLSNLTHAPLLGIDVSTSEGKSTTKADGSFAVNGKNDGERATFQGSGYERAIFALSRSGSNSVVVRADPKGTEIQEVVWEDQGAWDKAWTLVYPDAHAYVTESEFLQAGRSLYGSGERIRVVVNSVSYDDWTFPGCPNGKLGRRSFTHAARVDVTYLVTAGGKEKRIRSYVHRVETTTGLWAAFPTLGCPPGPTV